MFKVSKELQNNHTLANLYAKAMLLPYDNAMRIPDGPKKLSTIVRARRTIIVPVDSAVEDGRFAGFFQPKLGDPSNISSYQCAFYDFTKGAHASKDDPSTWRHVIDDVDVSMDVNYPQLMSPVPSGAMARTMASGLYARPFEGATPLIIDGRDGVDPNFRWNEVAYVDGAFSASRIILTPGGYEVELRAAGGAGAASRPFPFTLYKLKGSVRTVVTPRYDIMTDTNVQWIGMVKYYATLDVGESFLVENSITSITGCTMDLGPSQIPRVTLSNVGSVVESIRPVGMSVLCTCIAASLKDGGNIQIVRTAGGSWDKIVSQPWHLDGISNFSGYKDYKFKHGCFGWYAPDDDVHRRFVGLDEHNQMEYPTILVSGKLPEGKRGDLRIVVETVFEISHNSQLFNRSFQKGNRDVIDLSCHIVSKLPSSYENNVHVSKILSTLGGLAGGLLGGPVGGTLGTALGNLVGEIF